MNRLLRAQLALETARRELGVLVDLEQRGDDYLGKLEAAKAAVTAAQAEFQAAAMLEEPIAEHRQETTEGAELRSMIDRSNVGAMFDAVLEHRQIDGPLAELQQHYGLAGNQIPVELLETRAVSAAPGDVGQNQQPVIPYVFPQSVAAFLSVDMPTVGVGEAIFPVLTSELSVGTPAENAAQAETTGAFSADVLTPSRLQASFFYSREDRARFAGMDSALRENLSMGLTDGLDDQIISGTGGLTTGTVLANHAAAAVTTFDQYVANLVYGRVDGRYANSAGDVRILMGSGTYAHAGAVYRNNSVDRTALDRLMELSGGVRVSAHVPAVDSNNRQNVIIRRGSARDMVAPIWQGVTIIPDEVTKAAEGQIVITAVMLHAVKLLRADGFYKQGTQHS